MNTPIYDFLVRYSASGMSRFHMPGHKGRGELGIEELDITEIGGADVLYSASGIILESENNATELFDTSHTYYSTEGSTLAIKAMLMTAYLGRDDKENKTILSARNVHKSFVNAVALLDLSVEWLYDNSASHLCECKITKDSVREALSSMERPPFAVYITSPDYLGNIQDIKGISEVLSEYDIPLLVDNAHGAYLSMLTPSRHPIALGAAMCADSAHKTLPVLTGGAYLHISKKYEKYNILVRDAFSVFASTSPSFLILASLDLCNRRLADGYRESLDAFVERVNKIKIRYNLSLDTEPLKIVIRGSLSEHFRSYGIECEFCDNDYTVLMLTPSNTDADLDLLCEALDAVGFVPNDINEQVIPVASLGLSIREATLAPRERIKVDVARGRILASSSVSCPPAVPIVVSGEIIEDEHIRLFREYGVEYIDVVK